MDAETAKRWTPLLDFQGGRFFISVRNGNDEREEYIEFDGLDPFFTGVGLIDDRAGLEALIAFKGQVDLALLAARHAVKNREAELAAMKRRDDP